MRNSIYTILLCLFLIHSVLGQNDNKKLIYVSGIVKDSVNKPYYGVNVVIKSTRIGTTTDENGKYKIDITNFYREKENIILIYSFVGFKLVEKEIDLSKTVNTKNLKINIKLKDESEGINCNG